MFDLQGVLESLRSIAGRRVPRDHSKREFFSGFAFAKANNNCAGQLAPVGAFVSVGDCEGPFTANHETSQA